MKITYYPIIRNTCGVEVRLSFDSSRVSSSFLQHNWWRDNKQLKRDWRGIKKSKIEGEGSAEEKNAKGAN